MPLKRIFASNPRKRLHQRAVNGLFCYVGGLSERKPQGSPDQLPRATEERSQGSPANTPFLPLNFKNILVFALFGLRNSRGNTNAPQKIINFCHFSALFALFRGYLGATIVPEPPRCYQPIGNGSPQG